MNKFLIVMAMLVSTQAFAWTGTDLTVDYIDVKSSGHASVYFKVLADAPNPAGCSQTGTASWEGSNPSGSNFLSTFLAAKMAGSTVQIIIDSEACLWGGWPKLLTVRVK
ncbi:hypothetical protein A9Q81_06835 [Gammaproteobacteria bacterium 42_54_T18]|nr:hypothetical protein A9Q81_06835 [Gammaproteobacteria bacterium 42_54_T18]